MKNKLIITENEKRYIKSLYGLLNEQDEDKIITVNFNELFSDGRYRIQDSNRFKQKLDAELLPFLKENPNTEITITALGGESATRQNFDYELGDGISRPNYYLAGMRRAEMIRQLKDYFKNSTIEPKPTVDESPNQNEVNIFRGRSGVPGQDRFMEVTIKAVAPGKCLIGLKIEVIYTEIDGKTGDPIDSKFPCRGLRELGGAQPNFTKGRFHRCDAAEFNVLLNDVVIGAVNLNNSVKNRENGSISGVVEVTKEKSLEIGSKNIDTLKLSLQCISKTDCHSDIPEIKISNKNGVIYHSCTPVTKRGETGIIDLLTLDKCGTKPLSQSGRGGSINPTPKPIEPPIDFNTYMERAIKKQDETIAKAETEAKTNPSVKIPNRTFIKLENGNYKINCTHNQLIMISSFQYKCGQTIDKNGNVIK